MEEKYPILSESLYETLSNISSPEAVIARSLVLAQDSIAPDPLEAGWYITMKVSDKMSMITTRKSEFHTDVEFSYLPKGRKPKILENGHWGYEGRQTSTPVKVARALLESTKLYHTINQVKLGNSKWHNYEPTLNVVSIANRDSYSYHIPVTVEDKAIIEKSNTRVNKVDVRRYADAAYESFANSFKASQQADMWFRVVCGEDIPHYYGEDTYYNGPADSPFLKGTLWDSCMKAMSPETFDIYRYCASCNMLIATTETGELLARALVWKTDKGMFMDRVYFYEDYYVNKFIEYAQSQGWLYKRRCDSLANCQVMGEKNGVYTNLGGLFMKIEGVGTNYVEWPYLDTFKYLSKDGTLSNNEESNWIYELESAGGELSEMRDEKEHTELGEDFVNCVVSGEAIALDNAVCVLGRGWVRSDLTGVDYIGDPYVLTDLVTLTNGTVMYKYDYNCIHVDRNRYAHRSECMIHADGWRLIDELTWCEDTQGWTYIVDPGTFELGEIPKTSDCQGDVQDLINELELQGHAEI